MSEAPRDALLPIASDSPERLISLDFIRGLAVMGILGANIVSFGQPFVAYYWPGGFATPPEPSDPWLWTAQFLLVDGKMRGLFTLLFGAGLALFADRAAARGASGWLQVRRFCWLFAFGLAHFYLLWRGDILTLYALCGLIALFALRWAPIQQLSVGMTAYLFGALWSAVTFAIMWGAADSTSLAETARLFAAQLADDQADGVRELALAAHGSYRDLVAHSVFVHGWNWLDLFEYSVVETLPLMLIGMGLYRAGLFDGRIDPRQQARWGWIAVIAGTALSVLVACWVLVEGLTHGATLFAVEGAGAIARFPVVLGLVALLALWAPMQTGWLGRRIVASGRMAFSNYLGTSALMLLVFQAPGLRLFGQLDRIELYGVMLATWALMLAWSAPWLARFRYGPLEWLWRCLTYGRRVPFRR